jgi:hypothetical protein
MMRAVMVCQVLESSKCGTVSIFTSGPRHLVGTIASDRENWVNVQGYISFLSV